MGTRGAAEKPWRSKPAPDTVPSASASFMTASAFSFTACDGRHAAIGGPSLARLAATAAQRHAGRAEGEPGDEGKDEEEEEEEAAAAKRARRG